MGNSPITRVSHLSPSGWLLLNKYQSIFLTLQNSKAKQVKRLEKCLNFHSWDKSVMSILITMIWLAQTDGAYILFPWKKNG